MTGRHGQDESVAQAVAELAGGRPVVVVDDADRENEGDLLLAAELATPEWIAFTVRHTSGVLCTPMDGADLDRLVLPPMTSINEDRKGTAYAVSVDARAGVTTGISAADRCRTVRTLADAGTRAGDLTRPGHVFPLRAAADGVLRRLGHTEAAVDLCRLAGLRPVGVIAEVVEEDGSMARLPGLRRFAAEHDLVLVSVAALVAHRRRNEPLVRRIADAQLPTAHGTFRALGYVDSTHGSEQMALVAGDVTGEDVLVRVHSECLTGDAFGSRRCDCGPQLATSLDLVAAQGRGVVVYLRGHEGRGIGLVQKLRAYEQQDAGSDTVDANLALGLPSDARDYALAAHVLRDLGVRSARLLTNNPAKVAALEAYGVRVAARLPLPPSPTPENLRYLQTKRDRMGHALPGLPEQPDEGWDPIAEGKRT